jgi:hypothetical protein
MVNRLIAFILVFAFLGLNFNKLAILVHYQLNKTEITEKYCENKDKPQMHCCGKCHLKKEMANDEERQKSPVTPEVKYDIQLFASIIDVYTFHSDKSPVNTTYIYNGIYLPGNETGIFHPPCC